MRAARHLMSFNAGREDAYCVCNSPCKHVRCFLVTQKRGKRWIDWLQCWHLHGCAVHSNVLCNFSQGI